MGIAYERGVLLYQRKRWGQAIEEFQRELSADPLSGATLAMISLCQLNQGKYVEARRSAEEAISASPQYDWGHYALAWVFYNDNTFSSRRREDIPASILTGERTRFRLKLAAGAIDEALRLSPRKAALWELKSMIAFDDLNPLLAITAARTGLECDATSATCQRMTAIVLRTFGDVAGATAASARALELEPENAASHASAGWSALQAGKYMDARRHFIETLRIDPAYPRARAALLQAMRARIAFYRPVLWLQRVSSQTRATEVAGAAVLGVFLLGLVAGLRSENPNRNLPMIVEPLIALAVTGVIAHFLADYLLLFDPIGRILLDRKARMRAVLAAGIAIGIMMLLGGQVEAWWLGLRVPFAAVLMLFAGVPLAAMPVLLKDPRGFFSADE